jgi:hypothetical protein
MRSARMVRRGTAVAGEASMHCGVAPGGGRHEAAKGFGRPGSGEGRRGRLVPPGGVRPRTRGYRLA